MSGSIERDIEIFHNSVVSRLGIRLDTHNAGQFEKVLLARLRQTRCGSVAAYVERFDDSDFARNELREIACELTVAETYFFRHPEHFTALAEAVIPDRLRAGANGVRLRVLSAGCAAGEEAYSLAATIRPLVKNDWDVTIYGIDINPHLLRRAVSATYGDWSLRTMTDGERVRYFSRRGREYVLKEELRRMVAFEERNLAEAAPGFWAPGCFDVVFCRNVMIYFSPDVIREMVARLARALVPGGYLFLAPSETLRGITQEFHIRHTHGAFYYQRRDPSETSDPAVERIAASSRPECGNSWAAAISTSNERVNALANKWRDQSSGAPRDARKTSPRPSGRHDLEGVRHLLRQEKFSEALRALEGMPRDADPDMLLLEAAILTQTAEVDKAREKCRVLLELDELNAGAHYLTAVCLEHSGDCLGAAEHDRTAAYLDPTFAMPHLHLGLLAGRIGDAATARRELTDALGLLATEDSSRVLLFGGGFNRETLVQLCRSHLELRGGKR